MTEEEKAELKRRVLEAAAEQRRASAAAEGAEDPGPTLWLASASPRRRELLAWLGVRYTVVTSRFNEASLAHLADPAEYVQAAAEGKACEVATRRAGVILGVDTDVFAPDGTILGKPADAADARRLLRMLSGATHGVYSGVAVVESDGAGKILRRDTRVVETRVTFADLPDEAIDAYVATGDPLDKAGAYGIQSGGMAFVTRVDGDLSNVIGLPLWTVGEILQGFGVRLWRPQPHSVAPPASDPRGIFLAPATPGGVRGD